MAISELPTEILEKILEDAANAEAEKTYAHPNPRLELLPARARLVNKAFHKPATALTFKRLTLELPKEGNNPMDWISKLHRFGWRPCLGNVKSLTVDLIAPKDCTQSKAKYYLMQAARNLSAFVASCSGLRSLNYRYWFGDSRHLRHRDIIMGPLFEILRVLCKRHSAGGIDSLSICLPSAFEYAKLTRLTETDFDIGRLSISGLMRSIRHLAVNISEPSDVAEIIGTGVNGWTLAQPLPGNRLEHHFWSLISSATNLHSLCIENTTNFDTLSLDNLTSLRRLELENVVMSQDHFLQLVTQNSVTLTSTLLSEVHLKSGTWNSTLLVLLSLDGLTEIRTEDCGYLVSYRKSMSLRSLNRRRHDIITDDPNDIAALGQLQRKVNSNRAKAGLSIIPSTTFEAMEWPGVDGIKAEDALP